MSCVKPKYLSLGGSLNDSLNDTEVWVEMWTELCMFTLVDGIDLRGRSSEIRSRSSLLYVILLLCHLFIDKVKLVSEFGCRIHFGRNHTIYSKVCVGIITKLGI